jgi:CubicO group peptidase (beta-lactamase class C family)
VGVPEYAIDDIRRKADELAAGYLGASGNVGLAIGVLAGSERLYFGYGAIAKGSDRVPDERTVFEIGSITKVFTAILMQEMAGRGEVKVDQPVRELLPPGTAVPKRGDREVTLFDLSTHSAGFPRMPSNWQEGMKSEAEPYANYTPELLYKALATTRLRWRPGTKDDYSNYGVGLLGHALELRGAKPYEELLGERVLRPLGMTDTTVTFSEDQQKRLATGHSEDGQPTSYWDIRTLGGAGALRSTVAEMLTFLRANLIPAETPLKDALAACHEPRPLARKFPPWYVVAAALVTVSLLVQWLVPVPPGSWKFLAAFVLPPIVTYAWRGFGAGLLASVLVWLGTFFLWGTDQFGWKQAGSILFAIVAGMYWIRAYLPSSGAGNEVMPGWFSLWFGDARARWHNGGTGGFRSFVAFVAESRVAVAVLSNSANDADSIGVELLRHLHESNKIWAAVPRTFRIE